VCAAVSACDQQLIAENKTSPFDFYQFFVRVDDAEVAKYLRMFTFLPLEEISAIHQQHIQHPEHKTAQRVLAEHVTRFVHGEEAFVKAKAASEALYSSAGLSLTTTPASNSMFFRLCGLFGCCFCVYLCSEGS